MFSRFPRTQSKIPSLIDYCVINRVLGRNREETSQYATVIIQSCSQECTLIANSPTFINILSALDRCNEWGLYYTGLVTFPHVVLLNQLNWFSIIFCLQSPDSQLFQSGYAIQVHKTEFLQDFPLEIYPWIYWNPFIFSRKNQLQWEKAK